MLLTTLIVVPLCHPLKVLARGSFCLPATLLVIVLCNFNICLNHPSNLMACYFLELHPLIDLRCYQLLLCLLNLNFKHFNLYTSYLSLSLPPSNSAILRPYPSPLVLSPFFWSLCTQSCLTLCNPMDGSPQASLSMEFAKQEYWSGFPVSSPGDLSYPGIEPTSLSLLHACVLSCFSHVQLCDPVDCSPPGSYVHGKNTGMGCLALL